MELLDKVTQLKFIQSLIYTAPKISDIVADNQTFEEGEFGLNAEEACTLTAGLRESPEYTKYVQTMENLDQQLDEKIQNFMLDTSIQFSMLDELQKSDDPNGDNDTDIVERAEKYTSEFKERINQCKK